MTRRILASALAAVLALLPGAAAAAAATPRARPAPPSRVAYQPLLSVPVPSRAIFLPRSYQPLLTIPDFSSPPRIDVRLISPEGRSAEIKAARDATAGPVLERLAQELAAKAAAPKDGARAALQDKQRLDAGYEASGPRPASEESLVSGAESTAAPLPASAPAASRGQSPAPPAPPSTPENPRRGLLALFPAAALLVLAADVLLGIGNEFWGTIFPKWSQNRFGPDLYSLTMTISMFTAMLAPLAGGWSSDKLGAKKTLAVFLALSGLSVAGLVYLAGAGAVAPALFVSLVVGFEIFYPAAMAAASTLPITIFKGRRLALERFNSFEALLVGIPGIIAPLSIGLFLGAFGVVGALWATPLTYAAALGFYLLVKAHGRGAGNEDSALEEKPVPKDPVLKRLAFWGLPAFRVFNYLMWYSFAVAYGSYLFPGAGEAAEASAIAAGGKILSAHSIGWFLGSALATGLLAALWSRWSRRNSSEDQKERRADRSLVFWVAAGPVGLLGFLPFLWTNVWFAAAGMILFGLSSALAQVKLSALLQANVEPSEKGRVLGKVGMINLALVAVSMYGINKLAALFPGSPLPFAILLAVFVPLSAYYLWLARRLKNHLLP